jgi:serine protein kinase
MALFDDFAQSYDKNRIEVLSLEDYFTQAKTDASLYELPAERMVRAMGIPELFDTTNDSTAARIFQNRTLKKYSTFSEFYGMEEVIEALVGYFLHSAQGLEEKKQILYLLGPVGGGKSSLAERLKQLMEIYPIYVLGFNDGTTPVHSPCFESPLGLFNPDIFGDKFEQDFNIPRRYLTGLLSPWGVKRLDEAGGDINKFCIFKMYPSKLRQIAIAKTEPGDENNQDISTLTGKVDLRKLGKLSQNDSDAYSYSGGLCRGNQGLLEFVEMFKAPIKTLHPLLTATQEGNYTGTEEIGAIPFQGIVVAHSNQSEFEKFRNDPNNEAFLDRICIIKVPYCLRVDEEVKIYRKMLDNSSLAKAPCAPQTLEMLAQFAIMTRLSQPENSNIFTKMKVYNGENVIDTDVNAKTLLEYKKQASSEEGMTGVSTRFAFKVLSATFNHDVTEVSADPVLLLLTLQKAIKELDLPEEKMEFYEEIIEIYLKSRYAEFIRKEIQKAFLESYSDFGQNMFDRYVSYAEHWIEKNDFKNHDTGEMYNRDQLNDELEKIEKPSGIANPKDFRNEVVMYVLKASRMNGGQNPKWTSYEKLRDVIEKKIFSSTDELLPVISAGTKKTKEDEKKHSDFMARMKAGNYTERQTKRAIEWHIRHQKSN